MCFNIYAHNLDDHTKNFSFLREKDGWSLAPAYDLTYSDTYYGEHTTSVNGKGKGIEDEDLIKVGCDAGLKKSVCKNIINDIKLNIHDIDIYLHETPSMDLIKAGKVAINDRIDDML